MPVRATSSPSRDDKKKHSGSPRKKSGRKAKSAAQSPGSPNLALPLAPHHADPSLHVTAHASGNRSENSSLMASQSGHGNTAGNQSLASTLRATSPALTSPPGNNILSADQDHLQPPHRGYLFEAAPHLFSGHSNNQSARASPSCTSLPTVFKDSLQDVPAHAQTTRAGGETAQSANTGKAIRKKPPLRRSAASQPNMISTSPESSGLDVARTPPSPQQQQLAVLSKAASQTSLATSEGGLMQTKKPKSRTPSPQPDIPPLKERQATLTPSTAAEVAAASASASASAAGSPKTTRLTPSPQPLEPNGNKPQRNVAVKPKATPRKPAGSAAAAAVGPTSSASPVSAAAASKSWSPPMNTHESPEYLPTDAPNVVVPARKYAYDTKTCTWKEVEIMLRVLHPNRGVSQGAMRVCFVVDELDERGFSTPMVAKMFRHNLEGIVDEDYFNEGEAQCICGIFAERYNKIEVPKDVDRFVISFLQCDTVRIRPRDLPEEYQNKRSGFFSYRTTDSRDILFTMEPRLKGNFTKYTNNFGAVYEGFEQRLDREKEQKRHKVLMAAEAFSHFTLVESGGSMLVCDLQGVNDFLTDPQIHTEDGKGFGMGNMGQRGIDKWVEKHRCNDMCRALKLAPLAGPMHREVQEVAVETRVSYYKILRENLRSQAPTRPEDLIPLPKPLSSMTDEERLDYAIRLSQLMS